ncbi:hypothetical protein NEOLEDRAFT_67503 [Neolentinus lepideus HHB14362 ss-1]|uniref:Uncharacterized protein n=1 Tax=Neolentinus lepideus HHB14362 ss-1 TaxID=1314782 RepID=A0A165UAT0_9AGAM|nr:hypothetical protein NEOLEDRAFT_67503 [Neolentinus lepideus HHB14362 ss-1]
MITSTTRQLQRRWLLPNPLLPLIAATPCRGLPFSVVGASNADSQATSSFGDIVANFQDLSAVFSLFAADSVEKKLSDPKSSDWERMSAFWSIFGIVGAVRVYAKIASGLAGAETAGMELGGTRAYTSRRTKKAMSSCVIGPSDQPPTWEDDEDLLLGQTNVEFSPWIRPHVVIMGYSICPFVGPKAIRETLGRGFLMLLTVAINCCPTLLLRTSIAGSTPENIGLAMSVTSALLGGCILPILLQRLNSLGVTYIPDLTSRENPLRILETGDTVMTSKGRQCRIMWQSRDSSAPLRSADLWYIRVLSAITTAVTLVAYVTNYLLLGAAGRWRSYTWLGSQVVVLVVRYVLWAYRPHVLGIRRPTMLYAVCGSLAPAMPVKVDYDDEPPQYLPKEIVYFAVASAKSKLLNSHGVERHIKLANLDVLSEVAPRDLLQPACRRGFCSMDEILPEVRRRLQIVKLPWSVVEELYAAQGLILGANPWVLGGISLAAVVDPFAKGEQQAGNFLGLTTIHSCKPTNMDGVYEFDRQTAGAAAIGDIVGITYDNYGVTGTIELGSVARKLLRPHHLVDSHDKFRENVATCRETARANGPAHCEVHAQEYGDGTSPVVEHNLKTEPSLEDALRYGRDVIYHTLRKDHLQCTEVCKIFGF